MENVKELVFRNKDVRDLAWAIGSAPLLQSQALSGRYFCLDRDWSADQFQKHRLWLLELDQDPSSLMNWIESKSQALLGKRFETLLGYWFAHSPLFKLVESNFIIREGVTTAGEIDFIVEDIEEDRKLRIEVACKYYLGYQKSTDWKNWIGPNGHDTLELKMKKIPHQLSVADPAHVGMELIPAWLLKGYFFHHYSELGRQSDPKHANTHYAAGWYLHAHELEKIATSFSQWLVLPREYWLSPYSSSEKEFEILDGISMAKKVTQLMNLHQKAQMIVQVEVKENLVSEISRGFIVQDKWPFKP